MKFNELASILRQHEQTFPRFVLPDKTYIPAYAHVTEVGHVVKKFIDCGGVIDQSQRALLQMHVGEDTDHRMRTDRFAKILQLGTRVLPHDQLEVEVEYDCCVVAQYRISEARRSGQHLDLILERKYTECLARERVKGATPSGCGQAESCC